MDGTYDPEGKSIIAGDTDSFVGSTVIRTLEYGEVDVETLFSLCDRVEVEGDKEFAVFDHLASAATYDPVTKRALYEPVERVYRHKVSKAQYEVEDESGNIVNITGDHSIMVERNGELIEIKAEDINIDTDLLVNLEVTVKLIHKTVKIARAERVADFDQEYVYDLCMQNQDRPWFFGNNILLHNSVYFQIDRTDVEEAIIRADEVAGMVNASFPEFMRRTFSCSEGYDTLMAASRELVIEAGIWVKKKHYICRVADQEGKRVNYIKVMGLAIKKTVLPRDKAKLVEDMAVRMLDGEDWSTVSRDFVDLKTELMKTKDIFGLGLPKGVQGVETYTAKWKTDSTCRLPGHVAAAIHYNEMRKKYNDKMSPEISSGMKIKVFYLKGEHGRFTSMALPTDIEDIPKWFIDEFDVDRKAHVYRLLDKPFENIITAIGKRAPTKQSIVIDDAVEF